MSDKKHIPVLIQEVLHYLDAAREGLYIDCTLGLAGHAAAILEANPRSRLVGCDLDEQSLEAAKPRLAANLGRVSLYQSDFRNIPDLDLPWNEVRGVLADLGLSSFQLDTAQRGFSFNLDGPLDMRFDQRNKTTAHKILHKYSEPKLARLFRIHGELRQASLLARRIISARKGTGLETTSDLRRLVEDVCRWHPQKGKLHPAAKVFQALRIEVNGELEGLDFFLEKTLSLMPPGGRMVVLTFHSLEDRIVKQTFLKMAGKDGRGPFCLLTKKPVVPGQAEIAFNPRAHSAKLRAVEKV
jgi:16S rRNA (cytosine1402-N4)-methyltransferase